MLQAPPREEQGEDPSCACCPGPLAPLVRRSLVGEAPPLLLRLPGELLPNGLSRGKKGNVGDVVGLGSSPRHKSFFAPSASSRAGKFRTRRSYTSPQPLLPPSVVRSITANSHSPHHHTAALLSAAHHLLPLTTGLLAPKRARRGVWRGREALSDQKNPAREEARTPQTLLPPAVEGGWAAAA